MKGLKILMMAMILMPLTLSAQSYDALWRQVKDAQDKDLPQTELQVLDKIVQKAGKEKAYGHLLKAELMKTRVQTIVSTDSLRPAVERLQKRAEAVNDVPLQAVYYTVLGSIYRGNTELTDDWKTISDAYYQKAMEKPAELAAVKTDGFLPFVVKGKDSQTIYGDDLLSLIGIESLQYKPMLDYYLTTDNRRAQLMSALSLLEREKPDEVSKLSESDYIRRLDSLVNVYADLPECGEVAIVRYEFMKKQTDATAEQKINYIDEALGRWGAWKRMNELRNARKELTARQYYAALDHKVWIPNREQVIRLRSVRGIGELQMKIYKVKVDGNTELDPNNDDDYKTLKPLLTALPEHTQTRSFCCKREYEFYEDSLQLPGLPVGVYMMEVESQPQTEVSRTLFFVSDVRVLSEALPDNQIRYVVVNATTGQPIAGASLKLSKRHGFRMNKVLASVATDSKGEYLYVYNDDERPHKAFASTAEDRACPEQVSYGGFSYYENDRKMNQTVIYTDRAIYRPGQTVCASAIFYTVENGFEHKVMADRKVKAVLRDANYKVVAEKQLVTDAYGTVSTQFTLPSSALTGRFTVHFNDQSQSIRVEAYKRPTFQVEFPEVKQDYKDGDTLTVKATARTYAGVPVQGGHVRYKVERRMAYWWISYYRYWQENYIFMGLQSEEVATGETTTDEDGAFEVQMPMVLPKSKYPLFYNFVVVADVTDQAGETHQGQLSLPLGSRKTALTVDLPDKVLAESMPKLKLCVLNAAGNDISAEVRYQIDGGKWMKVRSNTSVALPKLKSGKHELKAEYDGQTLERSFVVFSLNDKRPAVETDDWYYLSATQFPNDGTPVTLQVGSSGDVHIVYTLLAGATIIEQGAVDKKNELINRKFTYLPEYGNGLTLSYAWVRDGKTCHHEAKIRRPLPDKQLTMKWETFRDRLTPGQQEEWTLKIQKPDGTPADAQLMATLYDKSLDQIAAHYWSLQPYIGLPMSSLRWIYLEAGGTVCEAYQHEKRLYVDDLVFSRFDRDCFPSYWMGRRNGRMRGLALAKGAMAVEDAAMPEIAVGSQTASPMKEVAIGSFDVSANDGGDEAVMQNRKAAAKSSVEEVPEVPMRENLQETAFFYPQLLADSTGCVSLKFTLPESLTTWRFMGIAHSKDMMYGYLDGEAVAQKDVMIQPNVPRFIRMGDQATISARVFNMTEYEVKGTAHLVLTDPLTNEVVFSEKTDCLLGANNTATVQFSVDGNKFRNYSMLICKMMFASDTFSDGEQHYLPVLPDRERVTVTVPFTQNEPGTKTIDLSSVIPVPDAKLTIEYTNNPAWLVLQALPAIGRPCDKSAISQAASLYANSLGSYIMAQNPQVRPVFEMWKQEGPQGTSLTSQLEKNQELKDLVLNETPWVMDADIESEQKQRLADFFDANLMQQRQQSAIDLLKKLQNGEGAWSWWEGMPGSYFMTVEISEMLVRLRSVVGQQQTKLVRETDRMLNRAFDYMNKEILELVAEIKRQEKKGVRQVFPSYKTLQYLYLSTLDGRKQPAKVQQAHNYLKALLKKDVKNQTIYEKAVSAIVLNAPLYIKSLKEYTVYTEEMGRYYDTPRAGYSWRDYRIPTQVAAIEAIRRLTPNDTLTIGEMQRWLLQQKRTQAWDTPVNSVDAICAFLDGRSYLLSPQPLTVLKVDGKPVDTSEATAGIGYVKSSVTYTDAPKTFTAEKTSTGTSWGAVYAQFMQPTKDIADQKSGISVKREILPAASHSPLSTVHDQLKVGSRIRVRLTIEADRDYDFVEVVDKRAACMEPVLQISGYDWHTGCYRAPHDNATNYYFDILPKGKHVIETEYYIDRAGRYETGTCTVQCAYAPEYRGTTHSQTLQIEPKDQ